MAKTTYIVLGMHRSGTSAIARMLRIYGISLPGELLGPAADNEKGFFEDKYLVDLNTQILTKQGLEWDSLTGFFLDPNDFSSPKFNQLKKRARNFLEERAKQKQDWGFKDPRLSRLLGFWAPLLKAQNVDHKFVVAIRKPDDVAASLAARDSFLPLKSLHLWLLHNLDLFRFTSQENAVVVGYEELINSPREALKRLKSQMPAVVKKEQTEFLRDFLAPNLQHQRETSLDVKSEWVDEVYSLLSAHAIDWAGIKQLGEEIRSDDRFLSTLNLSESLDRDASKKLTELRKIHDQAFFDQLSLFEKKEKEILEFRSYQSKLELELKAQKIWSDKLSVLTEKKDDSIVELQSHQAKLQKELRKLSGVVTKREKNIVEFKTYQQRLEADAQKLQAIVSQKDLDITAFRDYQSKLETDLDQQKKRSAELSEQLKSKEDDVAEFLEDEARLRQELQEVKDWSELLDDEVTQHQKTIKEQGNWSDKLSADVTALTKEIVNQSMVIENHRVENENLRTDVLAVQASYQHTLGVIENQEAFINNLRQEVKDEQTVAEGEYGRLWAIIEDHRRGIESMERTYSWRLTSPFRAVVRGVKRIPGLLWRGIKYVPKTFIFSLKPDNVVRQRVLRSYERWLAFLHHDIDNYSIREAHKGLIADRWDLLGEKPSLNDEALPNLDVSVVTYNSERWINSFIRSLSDQDYPLWKLNVVFVDNGSDDRTVEMIEAIDEASFGSVQLIEGRNVGFGEGHNRGLAEGSNDLVLVTNVDLQFHKDGIRQAVSFAVQDQTDVASWELRQKPYEHPKFYDPVTLQTSWSSHACILMRREAFTFVGGYEKKIFMYGEDVELSFRFRSMGYKLRYLPSACVNHYTYEEVNEVKLLQYGGSTLANAYLRMRYGSVVDVLKILPMYLRLLTGSGGVEEHRMLIWGNAFKVIGNFWYFMLRRKLTGVYPFRAWDYDIVRGGAFYDLENTKIDGPLVSVVTRTYKGRDKLLLQCLQTVSNQTYEHVEHVIVEDGGDTMIETIAEYRDKYPSSNINYIPMDKVGRCHTGNRGLEACKGKYIVFLDDDDLFFLDHLEVCVSELELDPDISAAYSLAWEVETEFDGNTYEERSHGTPPVLNQNFDYQVLKHHNFIPIQAIVFERSLYERHGGFDSELDNLEDWNLWVRFASTSKFKLIDKTTSMFRTPWDIGEKSRRQSILDNYIEVAIAKNNSYRP